MTGEPLLYEHIARLVQGPWNLNGQLGLVEADEIGETVAPIIVNSSRAVLYAASGEDFAQAARHEALRTRDVLQEAKLYVGD